MSFEKSKLLAEITDYLKDKITRRVNYCGVAKGDTAVFINSTDEEGNDFTIEIKIAE